MSSGLVSHTVAEPKTDGRAGFSGLGEAPTKKNIISTENFKVRIVGRHPERGNPPAGIPFSVDVEVQTNINKEGLFRIPFMCPDSIVVIRGLFEHREKVWGKKFVTSRFTNSCTGRENIQLPGFTPDESHWVQIEVYDEGVGLDGVSQADPVAVSSPMHFGVDLKQGQKLGLYDKPFASLTEDITTDVKEAGFGNILNKALFIGAAGIGLYFLLPFFPHIKDKLTEVINERQSN